ncbi:MAG: hypothetical protein VX860_01200 [Verrucomicrobiota bacterium]|nr:hypothetical protein [Verrucomicrobiota bacterium]
MRNRPRCLSTWFHGKQTTLRCLSSRFWYRSFTSDSGFWLLVAAIAVYAEGLPIVARVAAPAVRMNERLSSVCNLVFMVELYDGYYLRGIV